MPFYGRGGSYFSSFNDYKHIKTDSLTVEKWDPTAMVPYIADKDGKLLLGYDNPHSLRIKCEYALKNGLKGAMYWDYDGDNRDGDLRKAVAKAVLGEGYASSRSANYAGNRMRFKALLYYSEHAEEAHVQFARQTADFFRKLSHGNGFSIDVTTDFSQYPYDRLKEYDVVIMPNVTPWAPEERAAFEKYMKNGGGWVGFHAAAYNDRHTNWPWLLEFLGGGVFHCNNWPPQPVLLELDVQDHQVTKNLPKEFVAPASEWYQWTPSPRENPDVEVLVSLSPKNYPLGIKDVVYSGDWPVVWTNTNYRMIYLNMGHGNEEYIDATQNLLFVNAFRWVVSQDKDGDPFDR
jgi:type 1 glutamine amidotransferase